MKANHIIFDCDGVLVDSEPLSMELDWQLLQEHGVSLTRHEVMQRFIGLTFGALIEQVEREFAVRLPADLSRTKDARLLTLFEEKLQPVAGARSAVAAITLPMSAASNSPKSRVEAAFRIAGFTKHFGSRITTFEDVKHGKPAPDIYIEAACRAGTAPQDCLAVEDSLAGVTSAVAAGLAVLGFAGTAHDPKAHAENLRRAGASAIFFHMDELVPLVEARQNA